MLKTPVILGLSMAPRKNRRLLVSATYTILIAFVTAVLIVPGWSVGIKAVWALILVVTYNIVSYIVFGGLAKPTALLGPRGGEMTSLGLRPGRLGQDEPDEREVALRNAAHYHAFRAAATYGLVLWIIMPSLWSLKGTTAVLSVLLLGMPLLTMLLTLPQAIILWTEPDVPEEATV